MEKKENEVTIFDFEGKKYELRENCDGDVTTISVYCDNKEVTVPYTVKSEWLSDFAKKTGIKPIDFITWLKGEAKDDAKSKRLEKWLKARSEK
ncbi:MAG: hypothetical protein HQL03_13625 [Nitrospirae bacterium]|nr:hypothetical protein [Nitrospirota bacterium]MBF0591514.1 hypothetical protein [Nitrospirota bacterium]